MKKVLIVEDDPVFCLVYEKFLSSHGFSVRVAHDGVAGLEQLNIFRPDAVLLDLMMPKLNGLAVLQALRTDRLLKNYLCS